MRGEHLCPNWVLAFIIAAAISSPATAGLVLDQQLELINGYGVDFDYHQELSQSFTVGAAGLISQLGVQLYRLNDGLDTSNDVFISIGSQWLPVTHYAAGRVPVSEIPVVSSYSVPVPWTYVDVPHSKRMAQPGDQFRVVVSQTPGSLNENASPVYWRVSGMPSGYSGGHLIRRIPPYTPSQVWANYNDGDGGFKTFMETDAVRRSAKLQPVFDVQAEASSATGPYAVADGGSEISLQPRNPSDPSSLEKRGMMEFDLSAIPDDALITSAFLDLQISDFVPGTKETAFSYISIAGYAGNGAPDAGRASLESPELASGTAQAMGVKSFQLNVNLLEQVIAPSDYLGFVARALPSQYPSSFYTSEQAAGGGSIFPTLRLEYITVESVVGDFNGDGVVDSADYIAWRKRRGPLTEYEIWRTNYGASEGGATATSASQVPEPCGLSLYLCAVMILACIWTIRLR